MRKLKRPNGIIYEEFVTASSHHVNDQKIVGHLHITEDGMYTGRFWFLHDDGEMTKIYTRKTSPKWLLALLDEAIL